MNKTTNIGKPIDKIAVDITGAMMLLDVGRKTACDIGKAAGAVFKINGRLLFNVKKLQEYVDKMCEQ